VVVAGSTRPSSRFSPSFLPLSLDYERSTAATPSLPFPSTQQKNNMVNVAPLVAPSLVLPGLHPDFAFVIAVATLGSYAVLGYATSVVGKARKEAKVDCTCISTWARARRRTDLSSHLQTLRRTPTTNSQRRTPPRTVSVRFPSFLLPSFPLLSSVPVVSLRLRFSSVH
jgi:hypothetical protein